MNAHARLTMTKAEFRHWVQTRPEHERYELVNGVPRMMMRVKQSHAAIVSNWIFALQARLNRSEFHMFAGAFAVTTNEESFRLPDVSVERAGMNDADLDMTEPLLLVEVLSPSSLHIDMNEKVSEYLAIPSLLAYAICAQDTRRVWLYARSEGVWPRTPVEIVGNEGSVDIPAVGLTIPMTEINFGLKIEDE